MLNTILFTLLIVAICLVLLGLKVFFVKGGKFPNGHVSGNKSLRERELAVLSLRTVKHNKGVVLLLILKKP